MTAKTITQLRLRSSVNACGDGDRTEDRVSLALEEYGASQESAQPLTRESLLAKYSDVADELIGCLDSLDFIRQVAPQFSDETPDNTIDVRAELHPTANLGDFRILREIGRGGMGVVYEAEQLSLGRRVALKVLPFAAMLDKQQLARFKNEARAAATLDHPNIVAIYYVGSERSVYFYAMQLIEGQSLAEIIAELKTGRSPSNGNTDPPAVPRHETTVGDTVRAALSTLRSNSGAAHFKTVAQLGIQAAEALDHAHQGGILHRDIKPANLLLDDTGKLWVTDFGLARIEADAGMTMTGDILGTLRYMSPEQALAKRVVIDHRSDIYSLGVTLYELLTLRPAYIGEDRQELLRQIAFEEPRKPRQINAHIPADLETIILKAIEKNPADRYTTSQEFADDLRRLLENQPIKAKPATYVHQIVKWSRRHVGIVWTALAASLVAVAILGMSAVLIAQSRNDAIAQRLAAAQEKDLAIDQRDRANLNQYYAEIVSGQTDLQQGNIARLHQKLVRHLPCDGESDHRGWEWYYLFSFCHPEVRSLYHPGYELVASWSPDGEFIATPGVLWKAKSGECVRLFTPTLIISKDVAWSPDSQKFAWSVACNDEGIYIWDRQTDSVRALPTHESGAAHLAFSPNGKQLASSGGDHTVKIWDLATGTAVQTLSADQNAEDVDWSPDGELLAAGVCEGRGVNVWSVATGKIVAKREEDPNQHHVCLSWRPDGRQLAVSASRHWYILDRRDWKPVIEHDHPFGNGGDPDLGGIQWNPSGTQLAIAQGNAVTLWDPATDHPVRTLAGHIEPVKSVCWSPDGRQLVTADAYREIRVWDLQRSPQPAAITAGEPLQRLSWESDSNTLVSVAAANLSSSHWSATAGKRIKIVKAAEVKEEGAGILGPDRRLVARLSGTDHKRTITVRDTETGAVQSIWRVEEPFALLTYNWWPHESQLNFAWSPDGSQLAIPFASDTEEGLEIWDAVQEKAISRWVRPQCLIQNWDLHNPTWSPDGTRVAIIGWGDVGDDGAAQYSSHVYVIDVATGKRILKRLLRDRARVGGEITELGWSADGRLLALATTQGLIEVFDADTGQGTMNCRAHEAGIHALAWSPDGSRLATAAPDGIVKLIDQRGGGELLSLRMPQSDVALLAWSPDGKRLAAADSKGTIQLWDASRGYEFALGGSRRGDLAWAYYQLADEFTGKATDGALRMALELAPKSLDYRSLRGPALARLGQFDAAAKEFGAAVPAQPELGLKFAIWQAYALLGARDMDAYRDLCKRLVHAADDRKDWSRFSFVAWLGAVIPDAVDGFEDNVKRVRDDLAKAASEGKGGLASEDNFSVLRYGAMLYRLGHYADAVDALTTLSAQFAEGSDKSGQYIRACAQYFLAMARYQLGHKFQARRLLDQARATSDALHNDPSIPWFQPVVLNALQREATGLIEP